MIEQLNLQAKCCITLRRSGRIERFRQQSRNSGRRSASPLVPGFGSYQEAHHRPSNRYLIVELPTDPVEFRMVAALPIVPTSYPINATVVRLRPTQTVIKVLTTDSHCIIPVPMGAFSSHAVHRRRLTPG